ncbi:hypothetical protein E1263_12805 [Kribbella antibiotica]|uniref:Uncharacterized protein n=1 Tax=Kribbella antibiotica TaxID=190195 RepID=A0A4R4ZPM9_9ACTN|nr:hypothetical protein [Kribbella antibiotica]TDD59974.1 hypothetical protein E1263_12805 [Kribbella antibiotica]
MRERRAPGTCSRSCREADAVRDVGQLHEGLRVLAEIPGWWAGVSPIQACAGAVVLTTCSCSCREAGAVLGVGQLRVGLQVVVECPGG